MPSSVWFLSWWLHVLWIYVCCVLFTIIITFVTIGHPDRHALFIVITLKNTQNFLIATHINQYVYLVCKQLIVCTYLYVVQLHSEFELAALWAKSLIASGFKVGQFSTAFIIHHVLADYFLAICCTKEFAKPPSLT